MEYFAPCWIALSALFTNPPSKTYLDTQMSGISERVKVCNEVAVVAKKQGIDPFLAIAISFNETKFTYVISDKGAQGPLGVIPKYHCPKDVPRSECDLIEAGVNAITKALEFADYDLCNSLAVYNRGPEGVCKKGRSEYKYAKQVLKIYDLICSATDLCRTC